MFFSVFCTRMDAPFCFNQLWEPHLFHVLDLSGCSPKNHHPSSPSLAMISVFIYTMASFILTFPAALKITQDCAMS